MNDVIKSEQMNLPGFMASDLEMGVSELKKFIIPPRLKVVQPLSGEQYTEKFNSGDVVLAPQLVLVAPIIMDSVTKRPTKSGQPFNFVPVFFFPEYLAWNPLESKGTLPAVRERSLDPQSDIARKARNPQTREEPCPEVAKAVIRYQEHLNFIMMLMGTGDTAGIPVVMSFSRGEHRSGTNLASLIAMRRAPIFGCVFEATSRLRTNSKGAWYGLDITNPSVSSGINPVITDETRYTLLKNLHLEMKTAHANNLIVVDHDDNEIDAENDTKY